MVELADHPWFLATQFHPELKSRPNHPHPLFASFIAAAVARRQSADHVIVKSIGKVAS
jgi:CTP synthase